MKTAAWQHWRRSTGIWPILCERVCGLENENETFFVELWHVCDTKSCVKKFGGGKINEIYSGTISYADVNTMSHCLKSDNQVEDPK